MCSTSNTCCGDNSTFNGGGKTLQYTGGSTYYGSGGGATDVRLVSGDWDNISSLISRIMVAAGSGSIDNVIVVPFTMAFSRIPGYTRLDGWPFGLR